jgi:hypothetical protein
MRYALGKKDARPGSVRLQFGDFFSAPSMPTPPLVFGRPELILNWQILSNDVDSTCVQAEAVHESMLWSASAGNPIPTFTDANVLADYIAVNPGDTSYQGGTDMEEFAAYRKNTGVVDATGSRHKVDSYISLKVGDIDQLALAAFLFGAVGIGVQLPSSAGDQFDQAVPWSVVAGSPNQGGHAIPIVGRNSHGNFLLVSWGRLTAATPGFVSQFMDEGLVYLSRDYLTTAGQSPRGYTDAILEGYLAALAA